MKKLNKKGFTLVELIVVIAIIGILAAVLVPSVTSYIGKAQKSSAQQNASNKYQEFVLAYTEICQADVNAYFKDKVVKYEANGGYICFIYEGKVEAAEKSEEKALEAFAKAVDGFTYADNKLKKGEDEVTPVLLGVTPTEDNKTTACPAA